jgi:hypothetical protein
MNEMQDEVLLLGSMIEQATLQSVRSLKERDLKASETTRRSTTNASRSKKPRSR